MKTQKLSKALAAFLAVLMLFLRNDGFRRRSPRAFQRNLYRGNDNRRRHTGARGHTCTGDFRAGDFRAGDFRTGKLRDAGSLCIAGILRDARSYARRNA